MRWLITDGGGGGGGWTDSSGSSARSAADPQGPRRPWPTSYRQDKAMLRLWGPRQCEELVYSARPNCCFSCCAEQSHKLRQCP